MPQNWGGKGPSREKTHCYVLLMLVYQLRGGFSSLHAFAGVQRAARCRCSELWLEQLLPLAKQFLSRISSQPPSTMLLRGKYRFTISRCISSPSDRCLASRGIREDTLCSALPQAQQCSSAGSAWGRAPPQTWAHSVGAP